MSDPKFTLVYDSIHSDWVAIYRDGKLLDQGHSFVEHEFARLLGLDHEVVWAPAAGGHFPMTWPPEEGT